MWGNNGWAYRPTIAVVHNGKAPVCAGIIATAIGSLADTWEANCQVHVASGRNWAGGTSM